MNAYVLILKECNELENEWTEIAIDLLRKQIFFTSELFQNVESY